MRIHGIDERVSLRSVVESAQRCSGSL